MPNTYPVGANIRFSVEFKDPTTLVYVDPTTVTFKIKSPEDGAITTRVYPPPPATLIVRDSLGHYHTDFTLDYPGNWPYRWEAAGSYIGANESYVCARDTEF